MKPAIAHGVTPDELIIYCPHCYIGTFKSITIKEIIAKETISFTCQCRDVFNITSADVGEWLKGKAND